MKYKEGDTVRVKSKAWFDMQKKNKDGHVTDKVTSRVFAKQMRGYCGEDFTISLVAYDYYKLNGNGWHWEDWMLETSAPKHTIQHRKFSPINRVIY